MYRFLRNVLMDVVLTWPLIYFGLFLHLDYVENGAIAFFWVTSFLAFFCSIVIIASDDTLRQIKASLGKRIWIHRKYSGLSVILEIAAIFCLGYFAMGSVYLVANLFCMAAKHKIEGED